MTTHEAVVRWSPNGWDSYDGPDWGFLLAGCVAKVDTGLVDVDGEPITRCDAFRPPIQTQRLDQRLTLTVDVWCWEHCPDDVHQQALRLAGLDHLQP